MTLIRSAYTPETFEVREGDQVTLKVTNVETIRDMIHGFALPDHNLNIALAPGLHEDDDVRRRQAGGLLVLLHELLQRAAPRDARADGGAAEGLDRDADRLARGRKRQGAGRRRRAFDWRQAVKRRVLFVLAAASDRGRARDPALGLRDVGAAISGRERCTCRSSAAGHRRATCTRSRRCSSTSASGFRRRCRSSSALSMPLRPDRDPASSAAFVGSGGSATCIASPVPASSWRSWWSSAAAVQARLYRVGHERDANAPIRAVQRLYAAARRSGEGRQLHGLVVSASRRWPARRRGGAAPSPALERRRPDACRSAPRRAAARGRARRRRADVDRRRAGRGFPVDRAGDRGARRPATSSASGAAYTARISCSTRRCRSSARAIRSLFGTGLGTVVTIAAPGCELRGFAIEGTAARARPTRWMPPSRSRRAATASSATGCAASSTGSSSRRGAATKSPTTTIEGLRDLPFGRRGDGIYLYRARRQPPSRAIACRASATASTSNTRREAGRRTTSCPIRATGCTTCFQTIPSSRTTCSATRLVGANIMNSRRITVERNRIARNRGVPGVGLTLKDCDDSIVAGNEIAGNARGLLLDGSSANQFIDNVFRNNDTAARAVLQRRAQRLQRQPVRGQLERLVLSGREPARAGASTAAATTGAATAASISTATASATRRIHCWARSNASRARTSGAHLSAEPRRGRPGARRSQRAVPPDAIDSVQLALTR